MNTDTPLPPDEPAGQNPPDGAIINYWLALPASGRVTLEIVDVAGKLVRRYSTDDRAEPPDPATAPVPLYWYRPPQVLSGAAGMHRFLWDLHYQPAPGGGGRGGLPIAAVPHNTVAPPNSPAVAPGTYTVKLTVDGTSYTQPLTVRMDPRVKTTVVGLTQQFTLSKQMYDGMIQAQKALAEIRELRQRVDRQRGRTDDEQKLVAFGDKLRDLEGEAIAGRGAGPAPASASAPDTLSNIGASLGVLMNQLQGADVAPTTQLIAAVNERRAALAKLLGEWNTLQAEARRLNLTTP
jgi:hypothetical protein